MNFPRNLKWTEAFDRTAIQRILRNAASEMDSEKLGNDPSATNITKNISKAIRVREENEVFNTKFCESFLPAPPPYLDIRQ